MQITIFPKGYRCVTHQSSCRLDGDKVSRNLIASATTRAPPDPNQIRVQVPDKVHRSWQEWYIGQPL